MKVRWDKGGDAEIVELTMDKVVLLSTRSSPPGSRIEGVATAAGDPRVRFKVHNCRREATDSYRIEGRPLDLPRDVLALLRGE